MATSRIKSLLSKLAAIILTLGALTALVLVLRHLDAVPRTDDAYAYADTINVTAEIGGRIVELPVRDNQSVKRGDLLFRVDPRTHREELARAKASLIALDREIDSAQRLVTSQEYNAESVRAMTEHARANYAQATDTLNRLTPLLAPGYVSEEEVDIARTAQRNAQVELTTAELRAQQATAAVTDTGALMAQRDVILADIALMELRLEMTEVRAPFDGRVAALKTTIGQYASPLKAIFTLINTEQWFVVANFRETDLENIRPGTPATVYLMSDTSRKFRGVVDSIGFGVLPDDGGLVMEGLPRVQRSINWVRVAQRFPVKIRVEDPDPELFRVGASAVALLEKGPKAEAEAPKE